MAQGIIRLLSMHRERSPMDNHSVAKAFPALRDTQDGFLLVEIMVVIAIISIIGLGITFAMLATYKADLVSKRSYSALHLAQQRMEAIAMIDPQTLTSASDTSTLAADEGVTYLVVTDVTVQSSKARKVTVLVTSNTNSARGGRAYLESSFALWGRR